ncbi:putative nucleolar complex protein 14 [Madurella mycetomatis]|uniref:Putative nucleolar complex protein 14 n=1 Tax=Madurella mycetomatis TaxID=100816 RepID=A0A175W206_9PEZI|nr:putative nucleolar complex protein 14 [Madurella mycetomatis]KXX77491.1 putative nucleolar complex protein 14 [Madurella mycetomatis]
MAGSQLKRLKASLREQGIIGPQQSKKQKRQNAHDQKAKSDKRLQRSEALASIREQFNPFQFKTNARGPKFEVTTNKPASDRAAMGIKGRPGLAKAVGEERRRQTLLVEMQRRNKVGGLIDRRFGEDDPNMSLEEKMIERYTREQQRSHKKSSMFDLEEDDEPTGGLTHMGKPLFDDDDEEAVRDDFADEDLPSGDESDGSRAERRRLKRQRLAEAAEEAEAEDEEQPERKKTKKEVYEEVIAKSKLYKYERQAAKEEDNELRAELDQAMPELQALLFQTQKPPLKDEKDDRGPIVITGKDKTALDKDYDIRVKQLAADKRSQPAERTKTDEEKAEEESNRLKELEEKRLRRMRGEADEEDEEDEDEGKSKEKDGADKQAFDPFTAEEGDEFGLGKGVKYRPTATELGFDDEDDFLIDDGLVASGSELDLDSDDMEEGESDDEDAESESGSDDDEFVKGILTEAESKDPIFQAAAGTKGDDENGIPYTFPCPQTHDEMLKMFRGIDVTKLPVAVQRIRALYHPKLDSKNKERLGKFSQTLVQHVAYLGDHFEPHWFPTLESLSRHIHSLAKTFPIEVAKAYRAHVQEMAQERPLALTVGDLVILTAIGTTFPTSDHFHQVVTPAMLAIARYLGQKIPQALSDYATGTFLSILALQYQQFSKRYVPELMNFCLNTLCSLAHEKPREKLGFFPLHEPAAGIRTKGAAKTAIRKLSCADCCPPKQALSREAEASLKVALISTAAAVLKSASETWHTLPAFHETFHPALLVLQHLTSAPTSSAHLPPALTTKLADTAQSLARLLRLARLSRRPLELHHHRPLAIRTYVPKFEDSFDPDKHYDPDRERAELAKLRAEHKRERKGALRELRKDAAFMARENLRIKKERDAAYEKKYKRLVAEIQGEEGRAANEYAREKMLRKKRAARGR